MRTDERHPAPGILLFRYSVLAVFTAGLLASTIAAVWMVNVYVGSQTWSSGFSEEKIREPFPLEALAVVRQTGGVVVGDVYPLEPAEKAGIKVGDTIVAINGTLLSDDPRAYSRAVARFRPGDTICLDVRRADSQTHHLLVLEDLFKLAASQGYLGVGSRWLTRQMADSLHLPCSSGVLVVRVDAETPAEQAGLRPQDIIVSLSGEGLTTNEQFTRLLRSTTPGTAVDIGIQRNADTLTVRATPSGRPVDLTNYFYGSAIVGSPANVIWLENLPRLFLVFLLLVVGAPIGWLRPKDPVAFTCSVLFLGAGMASASPEILPYAAAWPGWAMFIALSLESIGNGLSVPLFLIVLSVFPVPSRLGRAMRKWVWVGFIVCGFQALIWWAYELSLACGYTWGGLLALPVVRTVVGMDENGYLFVLAILAISLLIAQRIETRGRPQARLKILELGFAISMGAMLLLSVRNWIFGLIPESWLPAYGFAFYYIPFILFSAWPLTFAYTILARKVFGIRFIIRRGLQHLLVSKGALLTGWLLVFVVVQQVLSRSSQWSGSVTATSALAVAAAFVGSVGFRRVNVRLMRTIDRRFFREALDVRRLLSELSGELADLRDEEKIHHLVGTQVLTTLHPSRVVLLMRGIGKGDLESVLALESGPRGQEVNALPRDSEIPLVLKADDAVVQKLERDRWVAIAPETLDPQVEQEARLLRTGCELLVTIPTSTGLLGVMGLGPKLSEEPFSGEDKELLLTVAQQTGMALENAKLVEVAKREAQQAKELEIARGVQQNLFPKELLLREGWQFAAMCRPARAVGGDYYDVFEIDSAHVGLALGDVSGKGLGPALMMSSIHAITRNSMAQIAEQPSRFVESLNEHLVSSTSTGMFATFFVGVLDTGTGRLRYVNAGHNPPIVLAGASSDVSTLTEGGLLVGALRGAKYTDAEIHMGNGDLLVLYSDGITEAMNEAGEMFEEEKLLAAILEARTRGKASEILSSIIDAVDRFVGEAEQSDDITLVLLRRL